MYPFSKEDIVVNSRRALLNQLIIGLLPPVLVILGAVWFFSGQFSTLKANVDNLKQSEKTYVLVHEKINEITNQLTGIQVTLGFIQKTQDEIKERIK